MRISALLATMIVSLLACSSASAQVNIPKLPLPQPPSEPAPPPSAPAPAPQAPVNPQAVSPSDPNPLLGLNFYVDKVEQPAAK